MKYLFRAWWWLCKYGSSVPVCFIDSKSNLICKLVSLLKGILAVTNFKWVVTLKMFFPGC